MTSEQESNTGKGFETQVETLLRALEHAHPSRVRIETQPRLKLQDGSDVIPDFELWYHLPFLKTSYLIECQDRKRSSPQILQKIKYVKGASCRNTFLFVYPDKIPNATADALKADGVVHMNIHELQDLIVKLEYTLRCAPLITDEDFRMSLQQLGLGVCRTFPACFSGRIG